MLRCGADVFGSTPMKLKDVMAALKAKGSPTIKRILMRHGAREPFFGVRIGDMKPIAKRIQGDQALALQLYATGNSDAQYLAGMVADGARMTKAELNAWAKGAAWEMISGTTVPWAASESPHGFACARKWIDAKNLQVARAGWGTLSALAATQPDAALPLDEFDRLLDRVAERIHAEPDGVRYMMNNFVIAVGTYVAPLGAKAIATARRVGKVEIEMGETDCRVPDAEGYIVKSRRGAPIAPKRKTIRC